MDQNRYVSPRDRLLFLRSIPAFHGLSPTELMQVAGHMTEVYFKRGAAIHNAGEPLNKVHMLVEGQVEYFRNGRVVAVHSAPAAIGFLGVSCGLEEIPGDIIAQTNTTLLEMSRDSLMYIWETNSAMLMNSLRLTAVQTYTDRGEWPYATGQEPPTDPGEYPEQAQSFVERLHKLKSGIFQHANLEALAELSALQEEVRFPAGTVIWKRGDPAGYYLQIRYGVVRLEQGDRQGRIGRDFTLGLFEMLGQLPRGYTLTAETEVVAIMEDGEGLFNVLEDHPALTRVVLSVLSHTAMSRLWRLDED